MKSQPLKNFFSCNNIVVILIVSLLTSNIYGFNLVGVWSLVSIEKESSHGKWIPDCYSPTGLLIYTASGYMSAAINCMTSKTSNIPRFDSKNVTLYSGKYRVNRDEVIHFSENASDSIYYKKILERKIHVLNDNVIILTPNNPSGKNLRLTWKRIK